MTTDSVNKLKNTIEVLVELLAAKAQERPVQVQLSGGELKKRVSDYKMLDEKHKELNDRYTALLLKDISSQKCSSELVARQALDQWVIDDLVNRKVYFSLAKNKKNSFVLVVEIMDPHEVLRFLFDSDAPGEAYKEACKHLKITRFLNRI